jgi:hypothetical protein
MALNPLAPVTDYQSMLNRIFWFTSAGALGAVALLRANLSAIDAALAPIDFDLRTGSGDVLPIPGGYLLPAIAVGLVVRVFRPHQYLSRMLGVRERFEIDVIIAELAGRSGVDAAQLPDDVLVACRHDLMRRTFYRFTSSESPVIDRQLIHQALDAWSWFWISVEVTLNFVLTGLVLIAANCCTIGAQTLGGTLLLAAIGIPAIHSQCKRYAVAQVHAIMSEPARAAIVRREIDALLNGTPPARRAA